MRKAIFNCFPILASLYVVSISPLQAQTFAPVSALSFIQPFSGANPLPQTIAIANVGAAFNFTYSASTSTGGSWLTVSTASGCSSCAAPTVVTVSANPAVTLGAGTYSGQVVVASGAVTMTIPVALTIAQTASAFFDNFPGGLSFSMATHGNAPPGQALQVRNGGTGTLSWTLTASTSDGGNWLGVSASSGTAPSPVSVTITEASLPGAGATAGVFVGQLLFQSAAGNVTVPVSVAVGASVLAQVNPIDFNQVFGGANPLPQVLTVAGVGTVLDYTVAVSTANGGSWLTVSTPSGCSPCVEPSTITVTPNPSATLAVGSYTAQIVVTPTAAGSTSITIPVTLTIASAGGIFFDNTPGQMSFSTVQNGTVTSQTIDIRNGGSGTLAWTVTGSTADGSNWLTLSSVSGVAPSLITVGVLVANLPNGGAIGGTFIGQLLFTAAGTSVTVPISVVVGGNVFNQVNPISFTMPFGGANPLPQTLSIAGVGAAFSYTFTSSTATGGAWLTVSSPTACPCEAPGTVTAAVTASPTMAAGTYTGQIVVTSSSRLSMTVPVTLTVAATSDPFFDDVPGQLSFSMVTAAAEGPPAQPIQIRNGGSGTLFFTLVTSTADGGAWLTASAASGTAPSQVIIGVVPANLPNRGSLAGTFVGQLSFLSAGSSVTIPVTFVVGANVFNQVNPISFTMPFGGANPLPQTLSIAGAGAAFNYTFTSSTATGGTWLTVSSPTGCGSCEAPSTVTAAVTASPTLAAGTYTGQIVVTSSTKMAMTIPVTLTVAATSTPFFDNLPGQLSFSLVPGGTAPPSQPIQIRNGGSGTLPWTLVTSTADGGAWLSASAPNGTAPSQLNITVNLTNLPNQGRSAGTFVGQLAFTSAGSSVTVPVTVVVGASVFEQVNPISFTMPAGGANPLPQVLAVVSTGTALNYTVATSTATGGAWLTVSTMGGCVICATPSMLTATVTASPTMAAGTYTGQIVVTSSTGMAMTVQVTLNVIAGTVQVTFGTIPSGLSYTVDTTTYSAGTTLTLANSSMHTIAVTSPQTSAGVQNTWASWSDGGAISHSVTISTATPSYTATFSTTYQLTTAASPSNGGTVSPASGSYYAAATVVNLAAIPASGYAFTNWTGSVANTNSAATTTTIGSAPQTVTANFVQVTHLVTGFALNSPPLRNNFTGFVGMAFTVGSNPLTVYTVGRVCVTGNSQTHLAKFVSASDSGPDVPGGSAMVNMLSCTPGQTVFANLASPVTLTAGGSYYLVSQETNGGDQWYDRGTITTTGDASVTSAVWQNGSTWTPIGTPNSAYVPTDFGYVVAAPPTPSGFVTTYNLNEAPLRNNFSGLVGMQLTVGSAALSVTQVGRICAATSTQAHTVEFVLASSGVAVPGAAAQVNMSGCTPGQFVYHSLSSPVTLQANTTYYLVSQEFASGDQWFDQGTLTHSSDASVNSAVWLNGSTWTTEGAANTSYVPPNFEYSLVGTPPGAVTVNVGTSIAGPSFTVDGSLYTTPQVFTWVSGSTHNIGTTSPQGITGGSRYYFNSWSDSGAPSHMVAPTSNTSYTANFSLQYLLTANVAPSGGGSINPNPVSTTSDGYYNAGTTVSLMAAPNGGYAFFNWTGDLSGTTNPQSLTMSAAHTVTANFQASAAPSGFLTGFALNSPPLRNNYGNFVGVKLTVGSSPLSVASVGRVCVGGNSGSHLVKFVSISGGGTDVPGGSATVNMAGCTRGQIVYQSLANPIALQAGGSFYLVSQESIGGDLWYDLGVVSTTNAASVTNAVYFDGTNWNLTGPANSAYVPPDFQYTVLGSGYRPYVIDYNLNAPATRNDFTGYVGLQFTVGPSPITVSDLGRVCVPGSTGTHLLELVNAGTGMVVASLSAQNTIPLCSGDTNQLLYRSLATPVILQANTSYYLVSQETSGGDLWYNLGSLTTTSAAADTNAVYSSDGVTFTPNGAANSSYGPVSLVYLTNN